jgi:4-hydroxy-tetrahydrodipicolinate synthase
VKAALNLMGRQAGPMRLPLTEMEEKNQECLKNAMKEYGIL